MEAAEDRRGSFRNPEADVPEFSQNVKTELCTSLCKETHAISVDQEKKPKPKSEAGLKEEMVEMMICNDHGSSQNNEYNKDGELDKDFLKKEEPEEKYNAMKWEEPDHESMREKEAHNDLMKEEKGFDGYLYCEICRTYVYNKCEVHGPALFISDTPVPMGMEDRSRLTLPPGLEIRTSNIPDAGLGVFNVGETVPIGAHFGPYQGRLVVQEEAMNSRYSWVICRSSQCEEYIDATNETSANWMRYVNCSRKEEEQNLVAFQYQGGIFYRCCRPISAGQELLMWYQENYAKEIGITFEYLWNKKCFTKEKREPSFSRPHGPLDSTSQTFLQPHIGICQTCLEQPGLGDIGSLHSSTAHASKTPRLTHKEAKPYRCPQCGTGCSNRGNLRRHLLIHTRVKPYRCSHCEKAFSQKTQLDEHQNVHTRARPYPCLECGKYFTCHSALWNHRVVHAGTKPHRCPLCWKSFTSQSALKTHMSVHISQRPYKCLECGNSYTLKSTLQLHQRLHSIKER